MEYKSFEELAKEQGVKPIASLSEIMGGWPEDADFDGFLESVRASREDPTGEIATLTSHLKEAEKAWADSVEVAGHLKFKVEEVEERLREAVDLVQRWTTEMGSHAPIGLGLDTDEFLKPQQQGEKG